MQATTNLCGEDLKIFKEKVTDLMREYEILHIQENKSDDKDL